MAFKTLLRASFVAGALAAQCAFADESAIAEPQTEFAILRPDDGMQQIIDEALGLIGIRYRRSGDKPQAGFDCSGFVGYVFREGVGVILPRASRDISKAGTPVSKDQLVPGDLVFFNTMRRTFSHVGIYLGNHMFVHAPRTGESVRIDDLQGRYWVKRYSGARRMHTAVASAGQPASQ